MQLAGEWLWNRIAEMKERCDIVNFTCSPEAAPEQVPEAIGGTTVGLALFDHSERLQAFNQEYADLMAGLGSKALVGASWNSLARDISARRTIPIAENGLISAHENRRGDFSLVHRLLGGRIYHVAERSTRDGGFLEVWISLGIVPGGALEAGSGSNLAGKGDKPAATVTPRQQEVIARLSRGMSMKEVARSLGITPRTVAFHKYQVMEANGLRGNSDFVAFAIRSKLLDVSA